MKLWNTILLFIKKVYIPLRIKLSISHLCLSLLPILIISYVSYNVYSNSVLSETTHRMELLVKQTSQEMDTSIDSMRTLLFSAYISSEIRSILFNEQWTQQQFPEKKLQDYRIINDFIRSIIYLKKNISAIRLLPDKGISIIWADNILTLGYTHPVIPWYQQMMDADINEAFIPPHKPLLPAITGNSEVFTIGKVIQAVPGKVLGVIMIDIKADEINNILNKASIVNNLYAAVIGQDKKIIFKSDNILDDSFLDSQALSEINSTQSGTLKYELKGEKYMLMYDTSQVTGWKLIAFTKLSSLLEKAVEIRSFSLFVGVISVIISILLSIFLSFKLTTPLKSLYVSMEDIKNKNFDIYLPVSGNDEIGKLTRSFNSMVYTIKNLIIKEYEADLKRKDAELKALETQINPHFLYNTLETVNSIAYLKNVPEIATISRSLSKLFRYSIKSNKKMVTLADELYHTINYINIQKIRYGEKFNVVFDIPEDVKSYNVTKLILQPLIENSINHGIEPLKSGGLIKVCAGVDESGILELVVEDNGVGIKPMKLQNIQYYLSSGSNNIDYKTTESIGLANVHLRIQHYYGQDYGLTIESSTGKGTKVTIRFPAVRGN